MSKLKNDYICGMCKHYDSDNCCCMASGMYEIYEEDTCKNWEGENELAEEDSEAQRTDSAERENHRRDVEGEV